MGAQGDNAGVGKKENWSKTLVVIFRAFFFFQNQIYLGHLTVRPAALRILVEFCRSRWSVLTSIY